jgi:hypothetical protein
LNIASKMSSTRTSMLMPSMRRNAAVKRRRSSETFVQRHSGTIMRRIRSAIPNYAIRLIVTLLVMVMLKLSFLDTAIRPANEFSSMNCSRCPD